jgi:hypothetical protein
MRKSAWRVGIAAAALVVASSGGCRSAGARGGAHGIQGRWITRAELASDAAATLCEHVTRRWPTLVSFGSSRAVGPCDAPVGVYAGRAYLGEGGVLSTVLVTDVESVRRLTAAEAFAAFGRHHPAGAVEIRWRSAPRPGYRP